MKKPNEMKFTQLLSSLIVEDSRLEFLHDKYVHEPKKGERLDPNKKAIPFDVFKEIVKADPTTKIPQGYDVDSATYENFKDDVTAGKNVEWIIQNLFKLKPDNENLQPGSPEYNKEMQEKVRIYMEDLFKINGYLKKYAMLLQRAKNYIPLDKRNIKNMTVNDLFNFLNELELPPDVAQRLGLLDDEPTKEGDTSSVQKLFKYPGSEIVFKGPKFTVIKIEDKGEEGSKAASWFGGYYKYDKGESHWCTSPENSSNFSYYIKKGPLYVIMANDPSAQGVGQVTGLPQERYQFHFEDSQFMDRMDRQIDLVKFFNGEGAELKEYFKPMFLSGKGSSGGGGDTRIDIKTSSREGKVLAIYGFDEIFKNLNPNVEKITINNDTAGEVAIDIPEEIGTLVNLENLTLINCVKSLPESIGNCQQLWGLNLIKNKDLKSLPQSLMDIPTLSFVNIKGSNPNIKLPKGFQESFEEIESGEHGLWHRID